MRYGCKGIMLLTILIPVLACTQSADQQRMSEAPPGSPAQVRGIGGGCYMENLSQSDIDKLNSGLAMNNGDATPNLLPTARTTPLFTEGSYYVIAMQLVSPIAKEIAKDWYDNNVDFRLDGSQMIHPADGPHLFSYAVDAETGVVIDNDSDGVPDLIRGFPAYIPAHSITPGDHTIEVLVDGSPIPIVRADGGTSVTVEFSEHNNAFKLTDVTGGPGKGQITFNFVNPTAAFGLNLHTPLDMGHPNDLIAEWVFEDGSTKPIGGPRRGSGGQDWPLFWEYTFDNHEHGVSDTAVSIRLSGYESGEAFVQGQGSSLRVISPDGVRLVNIP